MGADIITIYYSFASNSILLFNLSPNDYPAKSFDVDVIGSYDLVEKMLTLVDGILLLDQLITGKSSGEKFNRFVLHTSWDEDYTFRGEDYIELDFPAKRVEELAQVFMSESDLFSKHIARVIREDGHRLIQFGNECGKLTASIFNSILFSHFETITDDVNGNFISGYMKGLRTHDEATWHTQLLKFLNSDMTRKIAVDCIWQSGFTKEILDKLLSLLEDGNIPPHYFSRFIFRRYKDEVPENLFQAILSELLSHPDSSSIGICTELAQDYYFEKKSPKDFPEELIFDILSAVHPEKKQNQMSHLQKGLFAQTPRYAQNFILGISLICLR